MWSKLVEELEPIGFILATVHSEHERELSRLLQVIIMHFLGGSVKFDFYKLPIDLIGLYR